MRFFKIDTNIDSKLVELAEDKLSKLLWDLSVHPLHHHFGTKLGGDPSLFEFLCSVTHICTTSVSTVTINEFQCCWNPEFVLMHDIKDLRLMLDKKTNEEKIIKSSNWAKNINFSDMSGIDSKIRLLVTEFLNEHDVMSQFNELTLINQCIFCIIICSKVAQDFDSNDPCFYQNMDLVGKFFLAVREKTIVLFSIQSKIGYQRLISSYSSLPLCWMELVDEINKLAYKHYS